MKLPTLNNKFFNDITKPIIFVAVLTFIFAYFSNIITSMSIIMQFIVVGLPLSFIIFYYFGKLHDGWLYIASLFLGALAWDLVMPPYVVNIDGVINTQAFLSGTATDTFFGTVWQGLGFNGIFLFFMTYAVTFAILFVAATFLFKMAKNK